MKILITGAAGFIGANFVLDWAADSYEPVVNLDKLAYAGRAGRAGRFDGQQLGALLAPASIWQGVWSQLCGNCSA